MTRSFYATVSLGVLALAAGPSRGVAQSAAVGPINVTIVATREELDQVTGLMTRLNGKLAHDQTFVDQLVSATRQGHLDDVADAVSRAGGVSKAMVHAKGLARTGDEDRNQGLYHQASFRIPSRDRAAFNPWMIGFKSESFSFCIGTTCDKF